MKLKNGKSWYVLELDMYTRETLINIIEDLLEGSYNILTNEQHRKNYEKSCKKTINNS